MLKKQTIGLVLPGPISYSETFFNSKITGLINSGFEVIIYCSYKEGFKENDDLKYCFQWRLSTISLFRRFQVIIGLIKLISFAPNKIISFYKHCQIEGISKSKIIRQLYINGHLLTGPKLDWLHFGFATMGLNRELIGKVLGCKLSTSIRGYDIAIYPLSNPGCYNLLWKKLDKLHTISDDLLDLAYKNGLARTVSITKITPAINFKAFLRPNNQNSIKSEELKILTIGRLHWKKGYEYAFLAMKELKEKGIKFSYSVVGIGEDWERLHFARYQLGLEKEIQFLGKLPHEEIPSLMWKHHIYLQPSVQEGFCNAVLEAQAAGLLCVVSDAEGLPENVLNGKTGWVVPKRNPTRIAQTIQRIREFDELKLEQITSQAKERVLREFNLGKQIEKFDEFYAN